MRREVSESNGDNETLVRRDQSPWNEEIASSDFFARNIRSSNSVVEYLDRCPLEIAPGENSSSGERRPGLRNESLNSLVDILSAQSPGPNEIGRLAKVFKESRANGELRQLVEALNKQLEANGSPNRIGRVFVDWVPDRDPGTMMSDGGNTKVFQFELTRNGTSQGAFEFDFARGLGRDDPYSARSPFDVILRDPYHFRPFREALERQCGPDLSVHALKSEFLDARLNGAVPQLIERLNRGLESHGQNTRVEVFAEQTENDGEWNYIIQLSTGERIIYQTVKTVLPNADGKYSPPRERQSRSTRN
jgi:hypothetical protein